MPDEITDGTVSTESEAFDFGLDPTPEVADTPVEDGAGQTEETGESTGQAPQEGVPAAEVTGQPSWEFEYNGRKFSSAEEAQQYFNTWNGRIQAADRRAQQIEQMNAEWNEWHRERAELIQEAERLKEAREKQAPGEAGLGAVDWKTVEKMFKDGRGLEAMQYMQYENSKFLEKQLSDIKSEIKGTLAPLTESRDEQIFVTELMRAAHNATDPVTGNYIYPEFNENSGQYNSKLVQTFGAVYGSLPNHLKMDPDGYGVDLAYHRAKAIVGAHTPAAAPGTNAPAPQESEIATQARQAARNALGQFTKADESAAEGTGGSRGTDTNKGGAYSDAMLKQRIRGAIDIDPVFGITR